MARPEDVDIYRGRRIPQKSDLLLLRAVATRLQGASSSYSPKCLQRVAAKLTCPRVDATSAYQTGLPWRPQICIMRCGSCPLKPAVEGRRSRKPHSPGPTPTSVPDSDRFPSGNCHATDRTCSVYGCNGLGRTHAAFLEAHNTLWETLYLSALPHPATEPLDSLLV